MSAPTIVGYLKVRSAEAGGALGVQRGSMKLYAWSDGILTWTKDRS